MQDDTEYFGNIQKLRRQAGADLVAVIVENFIYCGQAVIGGTMSVTKRSCAYQSGKWTFAHEIGHNFNAMHDPRNSGFGGIP